MRIRSKLTIAMSTLTVLAIFATGVVSYQKSSSIILEQTEKYALELVKTESAFISGQIEKEQSLPKYLTSESVVLDLLYNQSDEAKRSKVTNLLSKYVSDKSNVGGIFLCNDKTFVVSHIDKKMIGTNQTDRQYAKSTVSSKKPQISETLASRSTGKSTIIFTQPVIESANNQLLGYIGVAVNAESMAMNLKNIKLNATKSSYTYLLDEKGNYIYFPQADKIGKPVESKELKDIVTRSQKGEKIDPSIVNYTYGGQKMIAATSIIPNTNWVLVIAGDINEIQAPVRSMSLFIILIGLAIIVISFIMVFFIAKRISKPIINVTEQMNKIAKFELIYDESSEWLLKNKDETGEMAKAMAEMRIALRDMVNLMKKSSNDIIENAEKVRLLSEEVHVNSSVNSATTQQLSADMEETSASTEEIVSSISEAGNNLKQIADKTSEGTDLTIDIIKRAGKLKSDAIISNENAKVVYSNVKQKLENALTQLKSVEQINALADTILGITEQTNLLALNAAIEAARAGEAGKGFAVVSDEIRKLAEESSKTASGIQNLVADVHTAVDNMTTSSEQILQFLDRDITEDYSKFIKGSEQYNNDASLITEMMCSISNSTRELAETMSNITKTIEEVATTVNEDAVGVNDIAEKNSYTVTLAEKVERKTKESIEYNNVFQKLIFQFKL